MRALAWFLAAIAGTLLLAALLAWPVWIAAHALEPDWPFHRVVSRFWQLLLLAGLVLAVRRTGLSGRADWGYGLPRPVFLRQLGTGLALGLATMLPVAAALTVLGVRSLRPELDAPAIVEAVLAGALTGLVVALVEETFFRGLMYRGIARESGTALAASSTALVYAALHFFARARIPADEVGWDSGFRLLAGSFARFAQPAAIVDSFLTLVLVGLLLALVRARTGAIAAGIGLHMGWVAVIKTATGLTRPVDDARAAFLVGSYDGFTGWLVAAWAAALIIVAWCRGVLRPNTR